MQTTVCCLFTWTLDHGSLGSATIYSLRQTEPGSNQAISTALCHSLSLSCITAPSVSYFTGIDIIKHMMGGILGQEMQHQVNEIYLTFNLNRKEEKRNEVPSKVPL